MTGRTPKLACLWPGLPQLWLRGAWSGLALAIGFTALVNLLLVASLLWTDWLDSGLLLAGWGAAVTLWLASAWVSLGRNGTGSRGVVRPTENDLFQEAQTNYLAGNWFEAETCLNRQLQHNARDVDARLMLATMKRHTGQWDEALRQLEQLERFEDAEKWQQEIERERSLVAQYRAEQPALAN